MSNFDDAEFVKLVLKVSTHSLYKGPYTATQEWLFERVRTLRDEQSLTFNAISEHLAKFGVRSARGKHLGAEHVFSIYKKGNAYKARLSAEASVEVVELTIVATNAIVALKPSKIQY